MLSVEPSNLGRESSRSCQLEGVAEGGVASLGRPNPFMLKAET